MVDEVEPVIILIKTAAGDVFGAFCSSAWGERKQDRKFFGTGETFVFTFGRGDPLKVFKWVGFGAPSEVSSPASFIYHICILRHISPQNTLQQTQSVSLYDSQASLSAGQQLFQCAMDGLDVGCGALHILSDMNSGRTDRSATFDNEPLCAEKDFKIVIIEAIAFE